MAFSQSPEPEVVAKKFRAYRDTGDRELRNELVTMHAALATSVARRFARRGEPLDDLTQVASFALVKAVERFDPERGVSFTSFAIPTMLGEIKRHFRDRTWSAKVPRSAKERLTRLRAATDSLTAELQRSPTVTELAERLDLSIDEVIEALEARSAYRPAPFATDSDLDAGEPAAAAPPGTIDTNLSAVEDRMTVDRLLATLPERERRIVELRFYGEMTQTEIANEVGVSQMHVSRLLRKALMELSNRLEPLPSTSSSG
ncbi:MAG: polymerase sigma-B factor [Acidimicrobiia bacterium]|jgi:RNA polymerase sigma-B factor|nr:polymerase sigma-B factor [Acidimicrobiia bacterium]